MLAGVDASRVIENLVYTYAERIDRGDFDGVAALFEHATIHGVPDGPPSTRFQGVEAVRALYAATTRLHDGTPRTKHLTTNAIIEVDEDAGTASCRSSYCVLQATPEVPLQPIVTGRYHDTFHVVDGAWWFASRTIFMDQVGDLSHHLKG